LAQLLGLLSHHRPLPSSPLVRPTRSPPPSSRWPNVRRSPASSPAKPPSVLALGLAQQALWAPLALSHCQSGSRPMMLTPQAHAAGFPSSPRRHQLPLSKNHRHPNPSPNLDLPCFRVPSGYIRSVPELF
jgi:hypothetical protein